MTDLPNDAYWVVDGSLMAGPYPGKENDDKAIRSLTELTDAGVTHFLDLTYPKGVDSDHLEPYEHFLGELPNGQSPGYSRHSIRDLNVPDEALMKEILVEIEELTKNGEVVYVHCWGGVGRTGTVVACHLINSGSTPQEALDEIREKRSALNNGFKESPEMPVQMDFVRAWKPPPGANDGSS